VTRRSSKFIIDARIYGLFRTAVFLTHIHHKIAYECAATQQCCVESRGITRNHAESRGTTQYSSLDSVCPRSHVVAVFLQMLVRSEEAASSQLLANVAGPFGRDHQFAASRQRDWSVRKRPRARHLTFSGQIPCGCVQNSQGICLGKRLLSD
jgi:hypothetical protein